MGAHRQQAEEFDVVVAGGGGSGLMAAVEAAERGARVLLVERQPELGGATGMSVGSISASGTALQRAAGIQDDASAHFEDLLKFIPPDESPTAYNLDISRLMVETAPRAIARLTGLGVSFSGPHPEPPHRVYRMHNVVPNSGAYIAALTRAAQDRSVAVATGTSVARLQREGEGAVSGVALHDVASGASRVARARRGVVLAAGDAASNYSITWRAPDARNAEARAESKSGELVSAARSIGAAMAQLRPGAVLFRSASTPYTNHGRHLFQAGAILVNSRGRRFGNELGDAPAAAARQPGGVAYTVFDSRLASRVATANQDSGSARDGWHIHNKLYLSTFPGIGYAYLTDYRERTTYFFEAGSAGELAARIGVPAADLVDELRRFTQAARRNEADAFGREPMGDGVSAPPFYAIGPLRPLLTPDSAGLMVDRRLRVLDEAGRAIPGLYAAGVSGEGGAFLGGHGHHLAWAFGSGMIAGANAASVRR